MNLFEGGNAKTKSGEIASKVNIKEFTDEQYESFKKDIIKGYLYYDGPAGGNTHYLGEFSKDGTGYRVGPESLQHFI